MLELNTDRMLFTIGAVILGALLLGGVIHYYPGTVSAWSFGMANSVNNVDVTVGDPIEIVNPSFDNGSDGWRSSQSTVNFSDGMVYIPGGEHIEVDLETTVEGEDVSHVPEGHSVRVTFDARGFGSGQVQFDGVSNINSLSSISLFDEFHSYKESITRDAEASNTLRFVAPEGSDLYIDNIDIVYLGELQ